MSKDDFSIGDIPVLKTASGGVMSLVIAVGVAFALFLGTIAIVAFLVLP